MDCFHPFSKRNTVGSFGKTCNTRSQRKLTNKCLQCGNFLFPHDYSKVGKWVVSFLAKLRKMTNHASNTLIKQLNSDTLVQGDREALFSANS